MDESPGNLDPEVEETTATSPEPGNHNPQAEETAAENPESAPVHPRDKWDPAWRILTNIFVVVALGLTVNLVPRFWAGGPSVQSSLLTVIPAGLSLLFSKDFLDKASPTKKDIDELLKNCSIIPSFFREEFLLVTSIAFLGIVSGATCLSPQIAKWCYYRPAERAIKEKISDPQELSQAEAQLKVAIALKPDYADAHFKLGWLYELRQDLGAAVAEYKLAMQNGSSMARIRLASLYLFDALEKDDGNTPKEGEADKSTQEEGVDAKIELDHANIAAIVLMQAYKKLHNLPDNSTDKIAAFPVSDRYYDCKTVGIFRSVEDCNIVNNQLLKRSYYVALAWARVEQGRYEEATWLIDWAFKQHEKIEKRASTIGKNQTDEESNTDPPPTIIYCVKAEFLDRQNKTKPSPNKVAQVETEWAKCRDSIGPIDPTQDPWLGRAYVKLELLAKRKI